MELEKDLLRHFGSYGFEKFRHGQKELIEALILGRDALGVMPTGGGKSLCFQLPALVMPGLAVVISPLIALMKDQVDTLNARGVRAAAFHSGMDAPSKHSVVKSIRDRSLKLLYIAPERVQQEGFIDLLSNSQISFLAIDEAHCISHWGHDFRPDYRKLGELKKKLGAPVMALTATATQRVQDDIVERLGMRKPIRVITGFHRPNLSFEVHKCSGRAEKLSLLADLTKEAIAKGGSIVVYASTRKNVELVSKELGARGFRKLVDYYHAGRSDEERTQVQEDFLAGIRPVLVATNAFGMGIDKANVRVVAHYDIPGSVEAYYQEAGRAGRDGAPARCALLFNHADVATQEFFISKGEGGENQDALLKQLVRYAYAVSCRQEMILKYFGDPEARDIAAAGGCGNCDCCLRGDRALAPVDDLTALAARQALSAVARLNGRFGKIRICEILKGSKSAALLALGLESQPTYGLLGDWKLESIRSLVDRLLNDGYLKIIGLDYPVIGISPTGIAAMKGSTPIELERQLDVPETRPNRRAAAIDDDASPPSPDLLLALKAFRTQEAQKLKVPAYVVFHDKTLNELASIKPRALDALGDVTGFGPKRIGKYGEKVLEIISGFIG